MFLKLGKQGSTLAGVMDAFSIAVSIGLQYGVPLETYVSKFTNLRFEPAGLTDDPDIRMAQSIMDYIFRRLALDYLSFEERAELGIYSAAERARQVETGSYLPAEEELSEAESLKNDPGDEVRHRRQSGRVGRSEAGPCRDRPHHIGAVRGDHRHQRRRAALPDLRHQDAPGRQLLRLRGLRQHQRLQLDAICASCPRPDPSLAVLGREQGTRAPRAAGNTSACTRYTTWRMTVTARHGCLLRRGDHGGPAGLAKRGEPAGAIAAG